MTDIDGLRDIYKIKEKYKDNVSSDGVKYGDMDNGEFAYRLWEYQKANAESLDDTMPMGIFADQFNISNEDFGKMIGYSKTVGYQPTERTFADGVVPELGFLREGINGWTYGFGDEVVGSIAAGADYLLRNDQKKSYGELYEMYRDNERIKQKQYRKENPWSSTAANIGGTLLNPLTYLGGGGPAATTTAGKYTVAGAKGFGWGTLFGIGESEKEDIGGMIEDATPVGVTSALFSMGLQRFFPGVNPTLLKEFNKYSKDPTVNTMKIMKNKAYEEVKKSKIGFNNNDMTSLFQQVKSIVSNANQTVLKSPEIEKAFNLVKLLKSQAGKSPTGVHITKMDDLVQQLNGLYYGSNKQYPAIKQIIDEVDKSIKSKAASINGGNNPLAYAREVNAKYKKVEALDDEFYKVKGAKKDKEKGGVITQYKTAVSKILENPDKRKWFDDMEIKMMEKFVQGNIPQRLTQKFSDLAPGMRTFLTMMAFYGSYMQPAFMIPTMGGLFAKNIADKNIKKSAMKLIDNFSGLTRKKPIQTKAPAPGVSGTMGAEISGP